MNLLRPDLAAKQQAAESAHSNEQEAERHAVLTALGVGGVAHLVHLRGLLGCSPLRLGALVTKLEADGYLRLDDHQIVRLSSAGARVIELERDHA